jgi:spore coat protein U-like protein
MTPQAVAQTIVRWLGAILLAAAALHAGAGSAEAACTVSVTSGMAFGTYDVFNTTNTDSASQIYWSCDPFIIQNIRITMTKGAHSTTYSQRRMAGPPPDMLDYNLYLDSTRTTIWGDESEGTSAYYRFVFLAGSGTVNVYGRIPAERDVSVGAYSDTVTVVINF